MFILASLYHSLLNPLLYEQKKHIKFLEMWLLQNIAEFSAKIESQHYAKCQNKNKIKIK